MRDFSSVTLSTARLVLRPLQPGDAAQLFTIHADPEFMRYWSSPPWTEPAQAAQLIAGDLKQLAAGEHLRLGIVRKTDAALIGTCSLFRFDRQCRRAELGYGIRSDCWRQGYMTEAVTALIDYAFGELKLNRLEADLDPDNLASARSLEKLGFTREGYLRGRWIVGGKVSDSVIYGLLANDPRLSATAVPNTDRSRK